MDGESLKKVDYCGWWDSNPRPEKPYVWSVDDAIFFVRLKGAVADTGHPLQFSLPGRVHVGHSLVLDKLVH